MFNILEQVGYKSVMWGESLPNNLDTDEAVKRGQEFARARLQGFMSGRENSPVESNPYQFPSRKHVEWAIGWKESQFTVH